MQPYNYKYQSTIDWLCLSRCAPVSGCTLAIYNAVTSTPHFRNHRLQKHCDRQRERQRLTLGVTDITAQTLVGRTDRVIWKRQKKQLVVGDWAHVAAFWSTKCSDRCPVRTYMRKAALPVCASQCLLSFPVQRVMETSRQLLLYKKAQQWRGKESMLLYRVGRGGRLKNKYTHTQPCDAYTNSSTNTSIFKDAHPGQSSKRMHKVAQGRRSSENYNNKQKHGKGEEDRDQKKTEAEEKQFSAY